MDYEPEVYFILTTAEFYQQPTNAIVEFWCDSLTKLMTLLSKDLNTSIGSIYISLASTTIINQSVRLVSNPSFYIQFVFTLSIGFDLSLPRCGSYHRIKSQW